MSTWSASVQRIKVGRTRYITAELYEVIATAPKNTTLEVEEWVLWNCADRDCAKELRRMNKIVRKQVIQGVLGMDRTLVEKQKRAAIQSEVEGACRRVHAYMACLN